MSIEKQNYFTRFNVAQRIEHLLLVISFTLLAVTGLVQKYNTAWISEVLIDGFGGIELTRIIHRIAATVLMLECIYHAVYVGYKMYVLKEKASIVPSIKDGKDAIQVFLYNLGFSKHHPKMPRYNFAEKAEYWAMIWGTLIMGITGYILWNPILSASILPGEIIPASKAAHGMEAVLASVAILIWHFYNVHLKRFNKSMFNGQLSREEMVEEHALELEEIENSPKPLRPTDEEIRKRQKIFYPVSAFLSVILFVGVYGFVLGEQTAITTLPQSPVRLNVFSPQTPSPIPTRKPTPTPLPSPTLPPQAAQTKPVVATSLPVAGAVTWDGEIGKLFSSKCVACHGQMGGLDVSTYAGTLKGGSKGAGIVPKDAKAGTIISYMEKGGHAGTFSPEELEKVRAWISAGAAEK